MAEYRGFESKLKSLREELKKYGVNSEKALAEELYKLKDDNSERAKDLRSINRSILAIKKNKSRTGDFIAEVFNPYNEKSISGFETIQLRTSLAKATIGTIFTALGIALSALGVITIDDEDYMGAVVTIGGVKIKISDLAPITSSITFGAYIQYLCKDPKDEKLWTDFASAIFEDTIFGWVTDAIRYSDNELEYLINVMSNGITQYIPTVLKQTDKMFNQHKALKSSKMGKRFIENL